MPRDPMADAMGELMPILLMPTVDRRWLAAWRVSSSRQYGNETARQAYLRLTQIRLRQFPNGDPAPQWEDLTTMKG